MKKEQCAVFPDKQIDDILKKEEILKSSEYRHGNIYLTKNHLVWKKKNVIENLIVPYESIFEIKPASQSGLGIGISVSFGQNGEKSKFLPFVDKGFLPQPKTDEITDWFIALECMRASFSAVMFKPVKCISSHSESPTQYQGQLILNKDTLIFREYEGINHSKGLELEIPTGKIFHVSIQKKSEINQLTNFMLGPLVALAFPEEHKLLLIEYTDDHGIKQTLLLSFPTEVGSTKLLISKRIIEAHMKRERQAETNKTTEDPLQILKIRLAKGEINKEEYVELKKIIQDE